MRQDFESWLTRQGYAANTRVAQMHRVSKVEQHYGSLEEALQQGTLDAIIAELSYSTDDERHNRPNPSRIPFNGNTRNNLASYKNAAQRYARFLAEVGTGAAPDTVPQAEGRTCDAPPEMALPPDPVEEAPARLALERDMQSALRRRISDLDEGLQIVDGGAERRVESGFVDILCKDASGALVVVELKAGKTDARVIAQTLGYMGDLMAETPGQPVRGIVVAQGFDARTRAAARALPNLDLYRYGVTFTFWDDGEEP